MIRLKTSSVVLLVLAAGVDLLSYEPDDLCYTCSCSADGATVDCSRRGLTDIPDGYYDKVKKLNLSTNEIKQIPVNLRNFSNIVSIDLSGNRLEELPRDALQNLTSLEVLNLSKNNFNHWLDLNPNDVLAPATKLKILDLSYNKFTTLGNLGNQELLISSSLETLVLDHCEITSIHGRSPISGLTNLRVFKINFNPLLRIQNLISPTLRNLHASNCELSALYHNELSYLPSLVHLQLSNNYRLELSTAANTLISTSLKVLDISYCNVLHPSLYGFPNLKKAVLNHNMIRSLGSNQFINNTKLEYLDLSYNNIGSVRSDSFKGLNMLKQLDLSWNEIPEVPEDGLLQMPSLTQLKLSRNYLSRVGHLRSTSLNILDMSSCEISTIGKDSLEGLPSLIDLDLSRNLLAHIPDSLSSNTLQFLNLNYNRISSVNNFTFFMLPRLSGLAVIGNRFTNIWKKSYFEANPYLERLDLNDNMWRCDCSDPNMYDFYEYVTLEPNKKEESYNLICNGPINVMGQSWLDACYYTWYPSTKTANPDSVMWFIIIMIISLALCLVVVNCVRSSMKRRLEAIQEERIRQVEEARDRLRQLRIREEQEALINTPDPRDLIAPPPYDVALSMPKLNVSTYSLNESSTKKKRRGRRKTKSSGDLLEETERNGNVPVDDLELSEASEGSRRRRRRRVRKYGSQEIADLEHSPGARRRRMSELEGAADSVTVQVEAELERPIRPRNRRYSSDDNEPRESDF